MTDPDGGPVLTLPERPTLDAESAAALAVMEQLDIQLATSPNAASVVLDPKAIARAVLAAVAPDAYPRIPAWIEGETRSIGGGKRPDREIPDPAIGIDPGAGFVQYTVANTCDHGAEFMDVARVSPEDAEQWHLAGLAACRAARGS